MAKDNRPGGNVVQPDAFPHKQEKGSKVKNVTTVPSGTVVGEKVDVVGPNN